jgi:CBS domain-containing protein
VVPEPPLEQARIRRLLQGPQRFLDANPNTEEHAMQIRECMTRDFHIVSPQDTIQHAARVMAQIDAGFLPVGDNDRLVGMLTDRDIAIRGVGCGCGADTKVSEVMTSEVKYCFEDEDEDDVLDQMADLQVRRLPVLNRDKRLVGVVSISDIAPDDSAHAGEALCEITRPSLLHSQQI